MWQLHFGSYKIKVLTNSNRVLVEGYISTFSELNLVIFYVNQCLPGQTNLLACTRGFALKFQSVFKLFLCATVREMSTSRA
jgi:hypothetical protein